MNQDKKVYSEKKKIFFIVKQESNTKDIEENETLKIRMSKLSQKD